MHIYTCIHTSVQKPNSDKGRRVGALATQIGHLIAEMVDEQYDKLLPIANVGRIMKQILPPSAKVSKEAKETMQECATEFISFVTGEASDKCNKENRKTVSGHDICWALSSLGFDNYAEAMLRYLHEIREFERQRVNQSKASKVEDRSEEDSDPSTVDENQSETPTPFEFRILDKGESSQSRQNQRDRKWTEGSNFSHDQYQFLP